MEKIEPTKEDVEAYMKLYGLKKDKDGNVKEKK